MGTMENSVFTKVLPLVVAMLSEFQSYLWSRDTFLKSQRRKRQLCPQAMLACLMMASLLVMFSLPAIHKVGIALTWEFLVVMAALNVSMLIGCGMCLWAAGFCLNGGARAYTVLNVFFYAAYLLVILKLVEMPALDERMQAVIASCGSDGLASQVTARIGGRADSTAHNLYVGAGYLLVMVQAYRLQRDLNGFRKLRALLAACLSLSFIAVVVGVLQNPIIARVMCGYAG